MRASRVGAAVMAVVAREKARKTLMIEAHMLIGGSGECWSFFVVELGG